MAEEEMIPLKGKAMMIPYMAEMVWIVWMEAADQINSMVKTEMTFWTGNLQTIFFLAGKALISYLVGTTTMETTIWTVARVMISFFTSSWVHSLIII